MSEYRSTIYAPKYVVQYCDKKPGILLVVMTALLLYSTSIFSQSNSGEPPPFDPSGYTGPVFGDLPDDLPDANLGAFEGGETGHAEDASVDNVLQAEDQRSDGTFNVPSNGSPSPLFGAEPFTQQMLRLEEFGSSPLNLNRKNRPRGWQSLPSPADAQSMPGGEALDAFLSQNIWPTPTRSANTWHRNPWEQNIEQFLGRDVINPPAEGRPPGMGWSHQRWKEF